MFVESPGTILAQSSDVALIAVIKLLAICAAVTSLSMETSRKSPVIPAPMAGGISAMSAQPQIVTGKQTP